MRRLEVGQEAPVEVRAREPRNASGIELEAGATYGIDISAPQRWWDAWIGCGPEGHDAWYLRPFTRLRRSPPHRWMALMGAVEGARDAPFLLVPGGELVPTRTGELLCFANDSRGMYWNNRGRLSLTLRRLA
jgi:hypothetical protein